MKTAVVWFRRNLRLDDNLPLDAAVRTEARIVPVFVLDDYYLNVDFSPPRLAVLGDSIRELAGEIEKLGSRLIVRQGPTAEALVRLAEETGADAVFAPRDIEPHPARLEVEVRTALERAGRTLQLFDDYRLVSPGTLKNASGKPFVVYTPYSRHWLEAGKMAPVPAPVRLETPADVLDPLFPSVPLDRPRGWKEKGAKSNPRGGSREAERILGAFMRERIATYGENRDRMDVPGTSRLSPHLRFGTVGIRRVLESAREAWREANPASRKSVEVFIKEICWREFYGDVLLAFPETVTGNFRKEFDRFPWVSGEEEETRFQAWSEGRTGYPVVDAAMRQLSSEGWMHNRARMIVASFLTKDLLVHWRRGEEFFRRHLADADLASNVGGWQWSAGTGTDAQPFFRIFNPVLQSEKFDPNGDFVRKYVPELSGWWKPGRPIHAPWKAEVPPREYPNPIVDHAVVRDRALDGFRRLKG
jgi:deoxyribodipyrimidine photo-lyase